MSHQKPDELMLNITQALVELLKQFAKNISLCSVGSKDIIIISQVYNIFEVILKVERKKDFLP